MERHRHIEKERDRLVQYALDVTIHLYCASLGYIESQRNSSQWEFTAWPAPPGVYYNTFHVIIFLWDPCPEQVFLEWDTYPSLTYSEMFFSVKVSLENSLLRIA